MKHLFLILFLLLCGSTFSQEKISEGNYRLINEVYYEYPISQAVFAKNTDKQAAWLLISQEELVPQELRDEPAVVAAVSISATVAEDAPSTEPTESRNTTPNMELDTEKEQKSLYFILKPDNTKIDLFAGDRFLYGTENEIFTYNEEQKKIHHFSIEVNEIKPIDSLIYSEYMPFLSSVQVQKSPQGQLFFVTNVWVKGTNMYAIFNEKFQKLYEFTLQQNRGTSNTAAFSVFSENEMKIFYTEENQYHIISLNTETAKYHKFIGECACNSSGLSSLGIVAAANGEYIVYHGCYSTRASVLYAYTSENKLKWTQTVQNYYADFQYLAQNNSFIGQVYSVPYTGFVNVSAADGSILEEKSITDYLKDVTISEKPRWLVYMPYQMQSFENRKKTICLLNCYSPTEPSFKEYALLTFEGNKMDYFPFPKDNVGNMVLSTLSENRILILNGSKLAIYESN